MSHGLHLPTLVLARLGPWLVLPRRAGVPSWCFIGLAVIGIDAYRHVATLDVLFLVQVFLCALAAVALLVTRHLLVVLAGVIMLALTGWLQLKRGNGR